MLGLMGVTDVVRVGKIDVLVGLNVTMRIPRGRYVLLAKQAPARRPAIDILCGARPPQAGTVVWNGRPSWPIARPGFVRGRLTGFQCIAMVTRIYELDVALSTELAEDMLSNPEVLAEPMSEWDALSRHEFGHILALLPVFDTYLVDGALPVRRDVFTRKWRRLFDQRIEGKTLILATTRVGECKEFCDRALILRDGRIDIEEQRDELLDQYPLRTLGASAGPETREREPDEIF